jgi:hypothetical protein
LLANACLGCGGTAGREYRWPYERVGGTDGVCLSTAAIGLTSRDCGAEIGFALVDGSKAVGS